MLEMLLPKRLTSWSRVFLRLQVVVHFVFIQSQNYFNFDQVYIKIHKHLQYISFIKIFMKYIVAYSFELK